MTRFFTTASLLAVSFVAAQSSNAAEIFGDAQNGDFGGDVAGDLLPETDDGHSADVTNSGTRRAGNPGDYFYENILFDGTGFSGIDQVNGNANPGHLANNNVTTVATFFANPGSVSGVTDPAGAFAQVFNPGDILGVSLTTVSNNAESSSLWDITIAFVGGTLDGTTQSLISGNFGTQGAFSDAAAYTLGAGETATGFNVISTLTNPSTGNDQIGLDNISIDLTPVPEPSSLALLGLGGLLIARRRRSS